ncbi:MAG: hypothetical protein KBA71_07310 [Opitutaceae bacterium]|nr:hypothetical protein [Opitutaceae bacterium]
MNPQTPTNEHLLFIRGTQWNSSLSANQLQETMTRFYAWAEGLKQAGILRAAQPLMEEGRIVSGPRGSSVTDGVFAESKEAIAGYFLLSVATMKEALLHARACPILEHGAQIEVRPVADLCRPMAELKTMAASV